MTHRALALLLLVGAAASCAPSPRAHVEGELQGGRVVAILPLVNFTSTRDAADRLQPMLAVAVAERPGWTVVDQGRVEQALVGEPWILTDRLPPDLVDSLGTSTGADVLLVGSVLAYGYRDGDVPQVSLSLRLLQVPGGEVLWSGVHNRDGEDRETVFGLGRVESLESLATQTVMELVDTFPKVTARPAASKPEEGTSR